MILSIMRRAMTKAGTLPYTGNTLSSLSFYDLGFLSFLLLQMFLTKKDKVVVVTRIVYFSEQAFVLGFLGPQRALL